MAKQNIGTVIQIIGPVLDIRFEAGCLPNLLNAIEIDNKGKKLVVEVAQHIGDDTVRCIAMSSTDGLVRGMQAVDTGSPITVPVGKATLGRIFNLLGEPVDDKEPVTSAERLPIHRPAPSYEEQRGFGNRHQGSRFDCALSEGRKNRTVRRRRRGQNRSDYGAD